MVRVATVFLVQASGNRLSLSAVNRRDDDMRSAEQIANDLTRQGKVGYLVYAGGYTQARQKVDNSGLEPQAVAEYGCVRPR